MKALETLNKYKNLCVGIYLGDDYSDGVDSYSKDIEECDEAIAELEALENRSCEGCSADYIKCKIFIAYWKKTESSCIDDSKCFYCNKWESK